MPDAFDLLLKTYGTQIAAFIFLVGGIWQFWPAISTVASKGLAGISFGAKPEDQAYASLKWLNAHFHKLGCTEGKQAVRTCLLHLLDDTEATH